MTLLTVFFIIIIIWSVYYVKNACATVKHNKPQNCSNVKKSSIKWSQRTLNTCLNKNVKCFKKCLTTTELCSRRCPTEDCSCRWDSHKQTSVLQLRILDDNGLLFLWSTLYMKPMVKWRQLNSYCELLDSTERKGKEVDLYSAYRQYNSTTKRSDVDHAELPANTPHLPFLRISIR